MSLVEKLKNSLDQHNDFQEIDILPIVGTHSKSQKAATIYFFINGRPQVQCKMNILCTMSGVGNAGIDSKDVRAVYRVDSPPLIADLSQECGRAGRHNNATAADFAYQVAICLELFLHIFRRIIHPDTRSADENYRHIQVKEVMEVASLLS
eukprot:15128317-Ditylum_brightwellii.AAC.1